LPGASVRLERPVEVSQTNKLLHVDVWIEQDGDILAIELKYKTRALIVPIGDEQYVLRNQSAPDIGRSDFVKDIERIEHIVADRVPHAAGYAILLTNDPSYWTQSLNDNTVDVKFRLHDGAGLHGTLEWGLAASAGTKHGREQPLQLAKTYDLGWKDYTDRTDETYGRFRYLVVKVKSDDSSPVPDPSDTEIN
jgi:hypothetical protein